MKRLLTIACVLFALVGAGQKKELYTNGFIITTDTTAFAAKYDTIPIIYLYADTARMMSVMPSAYILNGKLFEVNDTTYYNPNYKTYWDFGYEVQKIEKWFYPITIVYLDRHKNPIRKSIVLFMTKTIEYVNN